MWTWILILWRIDGPVRSSDVIARLLILLHLASGVGPCLTSVHWWRAAQIQLDDSVAELYQSYALFFGAPGVAVLALALMALLFTFESLPEAAIISAGIGIGIALFPVAMTVSFEAFVRVVSP
jgi:hypothetical protein